MKLLVLGLVLSAVTLGSSRVVSKTSTDHEKENAGVQFTRFVQNVIEKKVMVGKQATRWDFCALMEYNPLAQPRYMKVVVKEMAKQLVQSYNEQHFYNKYAKTLDDLDLQLKQLDEKTPQRQLKEVNQDQMNSSPSKGNLQKLVAQKLQIDHLISNNQDVKLILSLLHHLREKLNEIETKHLNKRPAMAENSQSKRVAKIEAILEEIQVRIDVLEDFVVKLHDHVSEITDAFWDWLEKQPPNVVMNVFCALHWINTNVSIEDGTISIDWDPEFGIEIGKGIGDLCCPFG